MRLKSRAVHNEPGIAGIIVVHYFVLLRSAMTESTLLPVLLARKCVRLFLRRSLTRLVRETIDQSLFRVGNLICCHVRGLYNHAPVPNGTPKDVTDVRTNVSACGNIN